MDLSAKRIAVVGLGYVGLPLAVAFGKIRPVLGFDVQRQRIAELQTELALLKQKIARVARRAKSDDDGSRKGGPPRRYK